MNSPLPCSALFKARNEGWHHARAAEPARDGIHCLEGQIKSFVSQKNFPCVAALQSLRRREFWVGTYSGFGTGRSGATLRADLLDFVAEVRSTGSPYLTFWAIFPGEISEGEESFERDFWEEISHLTSAGRRDEDWGQDQDRAPASPGFQVRLKGEALFFVGIHPRASRIGRRFHQCAFVVNAFSQFRKLALEGKYEPLVRANRRLDTQLQGSPNPMVVAHGEQWETIQFSGSLNPLSWKCPFRFVDEAS